MYKSLRIQLLALMCGYGFITTSAAFSSEDELRKSQAMQIFMGVCVVGRNSQISQYQLAVDKGFEQAPQSMQQQYLGTNLGKALWLQENQQTFGLALTENGLCSVFVHQGSTSSLQQGMEAWLPPKQSGFHYKKQLITKTPSLTTTAYSLYRGDIALEQWILTVNNDAHEMAGEYQNASNNNNYNSDQNKQHVSPLVAIMTYQKQSL